MIRLYFNRKNEAPQVWSVDEGNQSSEINVRGFELHRVKAISRVDLGVKVNADTPTAWIEVERGILEIRDGIAHIFHNPDWRIPRITG